MQDERVWVAKKLEGKLKILKIAKEVISLILLALFIVSMTSLLGCGREGPVVPIPDSEIVEPTPDPKPDSIEEPDPEPEPEPEPDPEPGIEPSEPVTSSYELDFEVPYGVYPGEEVFVDVTLKTKVLGKEGLNRVTITFEATGPENSSITFKSKDSNDNQLTFIDKGVWGPDEGYALPANYSSTTQWTLIFSTPGNYTITLRLTNLEDGSLTQYEVYIEVFAP